MDYRPGGSGAYFGRENHSPLRHPSPNQRCRCCPPDIPCQCRQTQSNLQEYRENNEFSLGNQTHNSQVEADNVTNPESVYIIDQRNSNPLRKQSPPSRHDAAPNFAGAPAGSTFVQVVDQSFPTASGL